MCSVGDLPACGDDFRETCEHIDRDRPAGRDEPEIEALASDLLAIVADPALAQQLTELRTMLSNQRRLVA